MEKLPNKLSLRIGSWIEVSATGIVAIVALTIIVALLATGKVMGYI